MSTKKNSDKRIYKQSADRNTDAVTTSLEENLTISVKPSDTNIEQLNRKINNLNERLLELEDAVERMSKCISESVYTDYNDHNHISTGVYY